MSRLTRRHRVRLEVALSVLVWGLTAVTAVHSTWVEDLTGASPDAGSGATEWWLVALVGMVALVVTLVAARDVRRLRAAGRSTPARPAAPPEA